MRAPSRDAPPYHRIIRWKSKLIYIYIYENTWHKAPPHHRTMSGWEKLTTITVMYIPTRRNTCIRYIASLHMILLCHESESFS